MQTIEHSNLATDGITHLDQALYVASCMAFAFGGKARVWCKIEGIGISALPEAYCVKPTNVRLSAPWHKCYTVVSERSDD